MKQFHWGILGTGWIASEMAEALMSVHGEIYAVCGTSMEKAERFASGFRVKKCYGDAFEMIHDDHLDILYIATPHSNHYPFILEAVRCGRHVLAEKSITMNDRQLWHCIEEAKKTGAVISDGTTILHMPLYKKLRQMIREGVIGKIKMIQVSHGSLKPYDINSRFFKKELAGGAMLDIGVYAVSAARFFMSQCPDIQVSQVHFFETGVDETAGIVLKNSADEIASLALSLHCLYPKQCVIAGEKGYIKIDNYQRPDHAVLVFNEDLREVLIREGDTERALQYEVLDMEDYIRNGSGEDNLTVVYDTMRIMTNIRDSWGLHYACE